MKEKSKVNSGLTLGKFISPSRLYFSDEEKHIIIKDLLSSGCTKREIWKKYTGYEDERGHLLRWMRKLGYVDISPRKSGSLDPMKKKLKGQPEVEESFDRILLKERIADLEKQLKDAEMKALAYSTMVDIAEKEFNISIKKKYDAKPLRK
ncbi:MAG: hypothetical protein OEW87_10335 [Flavobacteriaceae bacterium]|nr:hypothetical protein [Flavobacteriaceae bacterium]